MEPLVLSFSTGHRHKHWVFESCKVCVMLCALVGWGGQAGSDRRMSLGQPVYCSGQCCGQSELSVKCVVSEAKTESLVHMFFFKTIGFQ